MEVKELGPIVLDVRDLERSRRFYGEVLGWKEITRTGNLAAVFSAGRTHHELLLQVGQVAAPIPRGPRGPGPRRPRRQRDRAVHRDQPECWRGDPELVVAQPRALAL